MQQLRQALSARQTHEAARHLEAIDGLLQTIDNPLVRGVSFASLQSILGKPDKGIEVLQDLLEVTGDDFLIQYQLGHLRREASDPDGAIRAFARAAELAPRRIEAWLELGILLDERGEPAAALDAHRQALRIDPLNLDVWRNMGNALAAQERFDEAISAYETALGQHPGERTLVLLRAGAHQAQGDVERANALTPAKLTEELGEVHEVVEPSSSIQLTCRFRAVRSKEAAAEAAARTLLSRAATRHEDWQGHETFALDEASFIVVRGDVALVCDRDVRRPNHPNRFFDASAAVHRESRSRG